jgi:hypothetical protein
MGVKLSVPETICPRNYLSVNGVDRTVYLLGDLEVVTEQNATIVVTISYRHR